MQVAFRAGIKLQREVSEKSSFDSDTSSELFTKDPDNLSPFKELELLKHLLKMLLETGQ